MISLEAYVETTVIGIREAKINLSKLLKQVQAGNEVLLTDRGKPVGRIVPVRERSLSLSERLKRLEERGIIEPPHGKGPRKAPAPLPLEADLAQRFLQEDRNHDG